MIIMNKYLSFCGIVVKYCWGDKMIRTRNYTPVIIISFILLIIIIYLFISFKQKTITCFSTTNYDYVTVNENLVANFSGNSISSMT